MDVTRAWRLLVRILSITITNERLGGKISAGEVCKRQSKSSNSHVRDNEIGHLFDACMGIHWVLNLVKSW